MTWPPGLEGLLLITTRWHCNTADMGRLQIAFWGEITDFDLLLRHLISAQKKKKTLQRIFCLYYYLCYFWSFLCGGVFGKRCLEFFKGETLVEIPAVGFGSDLVWRWHALKKKKRGWGYSPTQHKLVAIESTFNHGFKASWVAGGIMGQGCPKCLGNCCFVRNY